MTKEEISSKELSQPAGVFAQATRIPLEGQLVFVSGLTSRAPDGSVVGVGDVEKQTENILRNLDILLGEAGVSLEHVVRVTVYVRDMKDFDTIHDVRSRFFRPPLPASTMVEVSRLVDPLHLIEIEAIAWIPKMET